MAGVVAMVMIVGGLVALAVGLSRAISANYQRPDRRRDEVAERLDRVRLGRALHEFGVERREFLHRQPVTEMHAMVDRCANCATPEACGDALARGERPGDYCPNAETLRMLAGAGEDGAGNK